MKLLMDMYKIGKFEWFSYERGNGWNKKFSEYIFLKKVSEGLLN